MLGSALSLLKFVELIWSLELLPIFQAAVAWYQTLAYPLVDLLRPVVEWLLVPFDFALPGWWREAVVLWLVGSAALWRGMRRWAADPVDSDHVELRFEDPWSLAFLCLLVGPLGWFTLYARLYLLVPCAPDSDSDVVEREKMRGFVAVGDELWGVLAAVAVAIVLSAPWT